MLANKEFETSTIFHYLIKALNKEGKDNDEIFALLSSFCKFNDKGQTLN